MAVDLARYVVSLEAQTAQYVQKLDQANKKLDRFHKDQERALGAIKKAFIGLGTTLAAALSVRAVVDFTKASIKMADQLGETARAAGVSAETLQQLRFTLDQLGGIAAGQTDQGLQRFNRTLGLAINGSRQAQQQFRLLGVEFKDALGRGRGTEESLDAVLKALGAIENDAQRAAIAGQLFGREMGPKLAAALKGGAQALEEARKQVAGIISDERVRQAEALDDAFKRMSATISGPLRAAAIGTAFEFAKLFGFAEDAPADILNRKIGETEDRVKQLTNAIEINQKQSREGLFGSRSFSADGLDRQLAGMQASLAQAQMNLAAFRAAAAKPVVIAPPAGDELMEIIAGNGKSLDIPISMQLNSIDTTAVQNTLFGDGLSEIVAGNGKSLDLPLSMQLEQIDSHAVEEMFNPIKKTGEDTARYLGGQFEDAFSSWILGTERSFSDLLKRMAVQMATSALFRGLGSLFPGGGFFSNFFGGGRAEGGPVSAGKGYIVGERGPEWFMPGMSGSIIPGGAGGVSINPVYNIDARGASVELAQRLPGILRANNQQLKAEISDARRRGRPI